VLRADGSSTGFRRVTFDVWFGPRSTARSTQCGRALAVRTCFEVSPQRTETFEGPGCQRTTVSTVRGGSLPRVHLRNKTALTGGADRLVLKG